VSWLRAGCGMTAKAAASACHLARTLGELRPRSTVLVPVAPSFSTVTMIAHVAEDVAWSRWRPSRASWWERVRPLSRCHATLTQATRLRLDPERVLAMTTAPTNALVRVRADLCGVFVLRGELDCRRWRPVKTAIDALSTG